MLEFHRDKQRYFDFTYQVTKEHIIPFIKAKKRIQKGLRVLEIGCGEAGVLKAFLEEGCICVGVELENHRIELAKKFLSDYVANQKIVFVNKDIYSIEFENDFKDGFDLVVLKDVIEHIPNQERFIPHLKTFLNQGGIIFYAFPPWMMPFGGHQQILSNGFASKLPYYHLLPGKIYPFMLRLLGSSKQEIKSMLDIRATGISIERFKRIHRISGFKIINHRHYLFNPIYKYKFNLEPRVQFKFITKLPYLRNYLTTAVNFMVTVRVDHEQ